MDRMPTLTERRISPRLHAVRNRCSVELGTPSGPRRAAAVLIDISREGALIAADEPIPPGRSIWFRMEEPARTGWVAAVAVRRGRGEQVGLRFVERCEDDLLLAATLGIALESSLLGHSQPESLDDSSPGGPPPAN